MVIFFKIFLREVLGGENVIKFIREKWVFFYRLRFKVEIWELLCFDLIDFYIKF